MNRHALPTLFLLLAAASPARAQSGPPGPQPSGLPAPPAAAAPNAEQRYADAQALFLARRYTEVLPIFRELYAESSSPNASLYIARCLREMGQLPEAYDEMVKTERAASERAQSEERFVATRESARTELRDLEARIGRVTLDVPTRPAGLEIEVNGRPVPVERCGAPLPVVPGTMRLWASAPGHATIRQDVEVAAGSAQAVTVFMVPGADGPARPALGAPAGQGVTKVDAVVEVGTPGTSGLLTAGIVAVGVGVLGMGTFAVSGILAENKFAEIEGDCNGTRCPDPSYNDSIQTGRTLDTVANVGLGVGLVALVLGGVLITVDLAKAEPATPQSTPAAKQALRLEGVPGGGTAGYRVAF